MGDIQGQVADRDIFQDDKAESKDKEYCRDEF